MASSSSSSSEDEGNSVPETLQCEFASRKEVVQAIKAYTVQEMNKSVLLNKNKSSGHIVVFGCSTVLGKTATTSSCPINIRASRRRGNDAQNTWFVSEKGTFRHMNCMSKAKPTAGMVAVLNTSERISLPSRLFQTILVIVAGYCGKFRVLELR